MPRDDLDDFWDLVEQVRARAGRGEFIDGLTAELARRPIPRIARFHATAMLLANRAATWEMLAAADIVFARHGGCSGDSFVDFRLWLLHLGRDVFEDVLADPDALADIPEIAALAGDRPWTNAEFPDMGELCGVGEHAFELVLEKIPPAIGAGIEPPDEFDERPSEMPRDRYVRFGGEASRARFPQLAELFGG
ncbi:DUF4240 domain-containing protein [Catellatospora chokoriensis]|uniref:DUF4240 domain-containing protein n=1 Tax=Catellatospora chokoriensis TaxID=310353 RepID=A0A8J3K464_9ACTN|nr:DUF4240 domain-containing protein [Catellatospora chokoriensis]GIF88134.1 hypothetical protein Cch02nite_15780 [Catellatospora chokoriensis]